MLEKLQELSKVILVPGAILYFLGFVSVSAYLARFGIVTFDIINARFILAGIFPLVSMLTAFLMAVAFHNSVPMQQIFVSTLVRQGDWRSRYTFIAKYSLTMFSVSIATTLFFNLGGYSFSVFEHPFKFTPLFGAWDLIGRGLNAASFSSTEVGYFFAIAAYGFGYVMVAYAVGKCLIWLVSAARSLSRFVRTLPAPAQPSDGKKAIVERSPQTQSEVSEDRASPGHPVARQVLISIHLLVGAVFFACLIWSSAKLHESAVTFNNVSADLTLEPDIYLAWLLNTTLGSYVFIGIVVGTSKQMQLDMFLQFGLRDITGAFQQFAAPLIFALFTFGGAIFPRIPFAIGGGQPRAINITAKETPNPFANQTLLLLGESNQFLFVIKKTNNESVALQINKDTIAVIETQHTNQ